MDKLNGLLAEADFDRIYGRIKLERRSLEDQLASMEEPDATPEKREEQAKALVRRFIDTAWVNRELLVSLIERVELTENKQIIIRFRFCELNDVQ